MTDEQILPPPVLAIVVPCFNEADCLTETIVVLGEIVDNLVATGQVHAGSYMYFVDDGSSDATWSIIVAAHTSAGSRIRGLRLSRNFGHQNALLAGLLKVKDRCDASISLDADLQQDPSAIEKFVAAYRNGTEVILGVRNDRDSDSWFKKTSAHLFYGFMRTMGVKVVPNHADYRLLGKRAMTALSEYGETNLFLRFICSQLGFRTETIHFDVQARKHGTSKYTLKRMLQLALHGITSSSVMPLRLVALTGLSVFLISFFMGCYVLYIALVAEIAVPGWASTTLPIYFIGGVQILCLGVVGEYVGQILREIKHRPRFHPDVELF